MKTCSLLQFAASASYYHHHSERSLSQWKERVLFLPSTLALFPQLWSLFKHQHTLPSATMSIQLATKITSVRPMLRQRGIRSQYPELWHLRERLIWPQYPQKPFILRISSVALHWCNKGSYRVSLLSCEMLVGRFQQFLKLPHPDWADFKTRQTKELFYFTHWLAWCVEVRVFDSKKHSRNVLGHLQLAEGINTGLIIKLASAADNSANSNYKSAEL